MSSSNTNTQAVEFTVLNDTPKGEFEVHAAGCADLKKGGRRHASWPMSGRNVAEAISDSVKGDLDEMGYTEDDFVVMPCAKDHKVEEQVKVKVDPLDRYRNDLVEQREQSAQDALEAIAAQREQLDKLEEAIRYSNAEELADNMVGSLDMLDGGAIFAAYGAAKTLVEFDRQRAESGM